MEVSSQFSSMMIANRDKLNDPVFKTARTKLQNTRSELNGKIEKELRMRFGAQNLLKVVKDKKSVEKINLELNYVDSNLQLLSDELEGVNSSLESYQNKNNVVPMIPLGLKETSTVDFTAAFKDYILEHYTRDPEEYEEAIVLANTMHQKTRRPLRNEDGIADIVRYYNFLHILDRRFFPPERSIGIYFNWFDSFSGKPYQQKTIVFEKASIVFNIAALYSYIATYEDHNTMIGLDRSTAYFCQAAGVLHYLQENFENPPSYDMKKENLLIVNHIFLAQAQECVYRQLIHENTSVHFHPLIIAGEACNLSEYYDRIHNLIVANESQTSPIPEAWNNLFLIKHSLYLGLAYFTVCEHLIEITKLTNDSSFDDAKGETLDRLQRIVKETLFLKQSYPTSRSDFSLLGKTFLKEALSHIEESIRLATYSKHLRQSESFTRYMRKLHKDWLNQLHEMNASQSNKEFQILSYTCPVLVGLTQRAVTRRTFNPNMHPFDDPFKTLGPIEVFNSRNTWTIPRTVTLTKDPKNGFGFVISGSCPVRLIEVTPGSSAERAGVFRGDLIISVGNDDARWLDQETIVPFIRDAGPLLVLKLVTLIDKDDLDRTRPESVHTSDFVYPPDLNGIDNHSKEASQTIKQKWKRRLSGSWFIKNKRKNNTWSRSSSSHRS